MLRTASRRALTASHSRAFHASGSGRFAAATDANGVDAAPAATTAGHKPTKRAIIERESKEWLEHGDGRRFERAAPRNWLHPDRPFPKNPWFVPPAPLADATRQAMYDDYCADPYKWTPRRLALKYNVSVIRAEAVLRLKHLERRQAEQGYVLQRKFCTEMERLLDADGVDRVEEEVDLRITTSAVKRPVFAIRNDKPSPTNHNAKSATEQPRDKAATEEQFVRRADGNYVLALSGIVTDRPSDKVTVLEEHNPREVNPRWQWLVADIGKAADGNVDPNNKPMVVRERCGRLRTATGAERRMHLRLYPQEPVKKLLSRTTPAELWDI